MHDVVVVGRDCFASMVFRHTAQMGSRLPRRFAGSLRVTTSACCRDFPTRLLAQDVLRRP